MPTRERKNPKELVKSLTVNEMYNYFVTDKGSTLGIYAFNPNYDRALNDAIHLCETFDSIKV